MPEVHVWLYDPKRVAIIDPTAGDFPRLCKAITGQDWPGARPPSWLWVTAQEVARYRCQYTADQAATEVIERYLRPAYLRLADHLGIELGAELAELAELEAQAVEATEVGGRAIRIRGRQGGQRAAAAAELEQHTTNGAEAQEDDDDGND